MLTQEKRRKKDMKVILIVFVSVFVVHLGSLVHSQDVNSCDTNDIDFNDIARFDTTAMSCQVVWPKQDFILRYAEAGRGIWSFLLSAKDPNSWVGIGFSTNGQMKGSSAMVGWVNSNGNGTILQYDLKDRDSDSVLPNQGELTVVNKSDTVVRRSNRIYMAFQLRTPQPRTKVLYAVGPSTLPNARNGFKLTEHKDRISTTLNYQTGQSQAENRPHTGVRKTHGALNMIGWGILMPIGAIVARYFRQWDPIWFYAHTVIQSVGFLLGLVGFILGLVLQGLTNAQVKRHRNLGITIFIFGCLQVTALLVRPQKGTKMRKYWNLYHHNAGKVLVVLAISNVFYGIQLGMEGGSWYGTYAVIVALLFVSAIVFEIRLRRRR
ncbi:hypothetical protein RND81_02G014400 [Saponaria officinalis]|uniref:Cytochrome b561 and DOMON domain-containing protein n=1 Tax=Saponaria officinalis TaxID=3572 RepID=A0AAW1MJE5_SAPOF